MLPFWVFLLLLVHSSLDQSAEHSIAIMAKPQWKVVQEEKERVIKEREEAEKKAKQEKMATLGSAPSASPAVQANHASTAVRYAIRLAF